MLTKKEVLTRMNTRVTPEQKKFLKKEAKRLKITEGELSRRIVAFYIDNNKK